jgi:uncharacterized protein YdgA (DUF945 family)
MKKLLVAAVVVIAILALLPLYVGYQLQSQLETLIKSIDEEVPGYSVRLTSYNKGWLSADAIAEVGFPVPTETGEISEMVIPFEFDLRHGPILFNDVAALGWFSAKTRLNKDQSDFLARYVTATEDGDLVAGKAFMTLAGNSVFFDRILPFTFSAEGFNGEFAGAKGQGTWASGGKAEYQQSIGQFTMTGPDGIEVKLSSGELFTDADYSGATSLYLAPSSMLAKLDSVKVTGPEVNFSVADLTAGGDMTFNDDQSVFDLVVSFAAASGAFNDEQVTDLSMILSYDNISAKFYEAYMDVANSSLSNPNATPDFSAIMQPEVIDEALAHEPGISLQKLAFTQPEGSFSGNAIFKLMAQPGMGEQLLQNPMLLMAVAALEADIDVDAPLAAKLAKAQVETGLRDQIEMQKAAGMEIDLTEAEIQQMVDENSEITLDALVQQGLFQLDAGQYRSSIRFAQGQLLVNGQELPLGALMQGF